MRRHSPRRSSARQNKIRALLPVILALVVAGCDAAKPGAAGATGSAVDTVPLRVVRAGKGYVPGMRKFLDISYGACLVSKGQAPAPAPAVPEATLANLVVHEEEELFDGRRWAKYETYRAIGADPGNQCQPAVFHARSVEIETTCESSLGGMAATLSELLDPQRPPRALVLHEDTGADPECDRPRTQDGVEGLPSVDAGQGARCVWNSARVERAAGIAVSGAGSPADICLYERRPFYFVKGYGRPVILQIRTDVHSLTGAYLPAFAGQIEGFGNVNLVSISEGTAISSDRFSRAAAEAFLRQPVKTALGSR
ncbi:hypothetical protein [Rubrivivax gelatinosus]|uniref:hypothetical protein n=1 Tax=Rubrivivax gelatinosus TaxID=28068 RepID=UPI00138993DA|nr:hypothetical protein [Rubrivivax gelatinosus]